MALQRTRIDLARSAHVFSTSSCTTECLGTTMQDSMIDQDKMLKCCKAQSLDEAQQRDLFKCLQQHMASLAGTIDTGNMTPEFIQTVFIDNSSSRGDMYQCCEKLACIVGGFLPSTTQEAHDDVCTKCQQGTASTSFCQHMMWLRSLLSSMHAFKFEHQDDWDHIHISDDPDSNRMESEP